MILGLGPTQLAMLACGLVLFLVAIICLIMRRSTSLVVSLVVLSIIMIGFPSIKSFEIAGAKVQLADALAAVASNPADTAAKSKVAEALATLDGTKPANVSADLAEKLALGNELVGKTDQALSWAKTAAAMAPDSKSARQLVSRIEVKKLTPNSQAPVSSANFSNLKTQVTQLAKQPDLTPESRVTLSKAQLALGQPKEAATNLHSALKEKPNLQVDPRLKAVLLATPHSP